MLSHIPSDLLKIPSQNGSPINEYRIHDGQIEFRSLDNEGKPFPYTAGAWRALEAADLQMHFVLHTAVAQWLMERLGAQAGAVLNKPSVGPLDAT